MSDDESNNDGDENRYSGGESLVRHQAAIEEARKKRKAEKDKKHKKKREGRSNEDRRKRNKANDGGGEGEAGAVEDDGEDDVDDQVQQISLAHNIRTIVKDKVYKKVKFVPTKEKKMEAAVKVAKEHFKIKSGDVGNPRQERRVRLFAEKHHNAIAKIINALRNEATTNLKREFMGTLTIVVKCGTGDVRLKPFC